MITLVILFTILYILSVGKGCVDFNWCNGHGKCSGNGLKCQCYDGWGSDSDVSLYKAPDCSARVCPYGRAWSDLADFNGTAHTFAECSNAGLCNRTMGICECFEGFEGNACQRTKCPSDCSGHGRCQSMRRIALSSDATVVGPNLLYGETTGLFSNFTGYAARYAWDADTIFGCVCDSSWPVGYDNGQYFVSEWFGPDCSLKRCPSNWDRALQISADNATSCFNVTVPGSLMETKGLPGSICYQECSNQGTCDYRTGTCRCFPGRYGVDCAYYEGYVPPVENITVIIEEDDTTIYLENLAKSLAKFGKTLENHNFN